MVSSVRNWTFSLVKVILVILSIPGKGFVEAGDVQSTISTLQNLSPAIRASVHHPTPTVRDLSSTEGSNGSESQKDRNVNIKMQEGKNRLSRPKEWQSPTLSSNLTSTGIMNTKMTSISQEEKKNDTASQLTNPMSSDKLIPFSQVEKPQLRFPRESSLSSCLMAQSRKAAKFPMDLPKHVHFHLDNSWENKTLGPFEVPFIPLPCLEALCHPDLSVSFRIVTNTSTDLPLTFIAMYGQTVALLDQCRVQLQAQNNFQHIIDSQGNNLYRILNNFYFVFFQNQNCHYTHSRNTISALTTMLALHHLPPPCLQNILCSPTTDLQPVQRRPDHWIWIPVIRGHLPTNDLGECFKHFQGTRHQDPPLVFFTISLSRRQHDLALFSNPQCYVDRSSGFILRNTVGFGNIPPSNCFSILCDQRFQLMWYSKEPRYVMAFGGDSFLLRQCKSQLSDDARSVRVHAIEGLNFLLYDKTIFFLPYSDCFSAASVVHSPLYLSIVMHNVTIPQECRSMLCIPKIHGHIIGSKSYYSFPGPNNLTNSCFQVLTPNQKTNDLVRVLPISPSMYVFQISPLCNPTPMIKGSRFETYVYLLASNVSFPLSCYYHVCQGEIGSVESVKDASEMFYVVKYNNSQVGCYWSLKSFVAETQTATDSNNCPYALLQLWKEERKTTLIAVSHPKCQITGTQFDFSLTVYQYMDMFINLHHNNDAGTTKNFFQCLVEKIGRSNYDSGLNGLRFYGKGVEQDLPEACVRLACDPLTIISFKEEDAGLDDIFAKVENTYITFHSLNKDDLPRMTHCKEALVDLSQDNSTLSSQGTLIPSSLDLSGLLSPPDNLFLVFPPPRCFFLDNVVKATVVSYFLIFFEGFPQECVERFLCDPSVAMEMIIFNKEITVYANHAKAYNDTTLIKCIDHLDNMEFKYFHLDLGLKFIYHKVSSYNSEYQKFEHLVASGIKSEFKDFLHDLSTKFAGRKLPSGSSFRNFIYDFSTKPEGISGKELIAEFLLGNHSLQNLESCIWCAGQSLVVSGDDQQPESHYLIVPHNNTSRHCNRCLEGSDSGVPRYSGVVSVVNEGNFSVHIVLKNATNLLNSKDIKDSMERYLYFIVNHLDSCALVDQTHFITIVSFHGVNSTRTYFVQHEYGLPCFDQIKKSTKFSCIQSPRYVLCRERQGNVAFLYIPDCLPFTSAKLEILSNIVVYSYVNSSKARRAITDLCGEETRVVSYVTPSDELYYEVIGQPSNLSAAIGVLQPRFTLTPSDWCLHLAQRGFRSCVTAFNTDKIKELVQTQAGIAVKNSRAHRILYQCITFVHPNATLRLFRLILINSVLASGEASPCEKSYKTHGSKVLGILKNDTFSMWVESDPSSGKSVAQPVEAFKPLHISSCPPLIDDINLEIATAAVAQNNTACLQDLCSGFFRVFTEKDGQVLVIGPLANSLYKSSCFMAIPPKLWETVNKAFQLGRATVNKFWPGCFYDCIIIYNGNSSKMDEWNYLSKACKTREIFYFIVLLLITLITIVGNGTVIYTLFYNGRMYDASCRLRINLAFADLLVGLFVQSRALHNDLSLMTGDLTLHQLDRLGIYDNFEEDSETFAFGFNQVRFPRTSIEAFSGFVFSLSSFVSLSFMSLMTLERFLMVAYQRHHDMIFRQPRLTWIVIATWTWGFIFSILMLQKRDGHDFVGYFDPLSKLTTSLPSNSIRSTSFIVFYVTVVFFTIATLLVVVVSALTFWKFSTSHERLRRRKIYANAPGKEILNQKLRKILTVFVTAYLISCLPLALGSAFNVFLLSPASHQIIWWIYLFSSAWNCYLYNIRLTKFRKDIREAFFCITCPAGRYRVNCVGLAERHISPPAISLPLPPHRATVEVRGQSRQIVTSL